jgi:hypothetical protein
MDAFTYYDLTVTIFRRSLVQVRAFLYKGAEHARASGMSDTDFLSARLAPDMFPLRRQIQIVTDNAKGAAARLTETAAPVFSDDEETVAALLDRIDATLAYLDTFTPEQFAQASKTTPTLPYFSGKHFTGHDYVIEYVLPNFFFHLTTAYAIIRHSGVPLGKSDYLGPLTLHEGAH